MRNLSFFEKKKKKKYAISFNEYKRRREDGWQRYEALALSEEQHILADNYDVTDADVHALLRSDLDVFLFFNTLKTSFNKHEAFKAVRDKKTLQRKKAKQHGPRLFG